MQMNPHISTSQIQNLGLLYDCLLLVLEQVKHPSYKSLCMSCFYSNNNVSEPARSFSVSQLYVYANESTHFDQSDSRIRLLYKCLLFGLEQVKHLSYKSPCMTCCYSNNSISEPARSPSILTNRIQ